jgi:hypothetical protein
MTTSSAPIMANQASAPAPVETCTAPTGLRSIPRRMRARRSYCPALTATRRLAPTSCRGPRASRFFGREEDCAPRASHAAKTLGISGRPPLLGPSCLIRLLRPRLLLQRQTQRSRGPAGVGAEQGLDPSKVLEGPRAGPGHPRPGGRWPAGQCRLVSFPARNASRTRSTFSRDIARPVSRLGLLPGSGLPVALGAWLAAALGGFCGGRL